MKKTTFIGILSFVVFCFILSSCNTDNTDVLKTGGLENKARIFCYDENEKNVAAVHVCGDYIKVISTLVGGGSKYYKYTNKGTEEIHCPVVGPDSMSKECKELTFNKLECTEICTGQQEIKSFEECIEAGYPALESWPKQCRVPGGVTFTEDRT